MNEDFWPQILKHVKLLSLVFIVGGKSFFGPFWTTVKKCPFDKFNALSLIFQQEFDLVFHCYETFANDRFTTMKEQ